MTSNVRIEATPTRAEELSRLLARAGQMKGERHARRAGDLERDVGEGPPCWVIVHEPPSVDAAALLAERCAAGGAPDAPVVVVARKADRTLRRALLGAGAMTVVDAGEAEADPAVLDAALDEAQTRFSAVFSWTSRPTHDAELATTERLRESSERYRALLESIDDGFCIIDVLFDEAGQRAIDYRFVELNASFRRHTGLEDAVGKTARTLLPELDPFWFETYGRVARTGATTHFERFEPSMNRWFEVEAMRVGAPERRRVALLFRDVTERRGAETALRRSEARFRRVFETNLLGIVFRDLDAGIEDANDEFLRIVGYARHDLIGRKIPWSAITAPDIADRSERAEAELRERGRHAATELELVRKDGSRTWVLLGAAAFEPGRAVAFVLDISRQKEAEAALRDSERRARDAAAQAESERGVLDAILDAAPAGIIVSDAKGKLLRFNAANVLLWGPAPFSESVDEYAAWKGYWADQSARHGKRLAPEEWAMARALRGETVRDDVVEIEPFDAPGTRRTIVNSGAPVRDAEGHVTGAVVVQMNISALVTAEAARRESEARFRELADNIAQLAWMADASGSIHWYNRRWFEYTGATARDMVGWGWQRVHHPDHVSRVTEKFRRHVASGEPWEDTFPLRGRDGTYRWFLSRAFPLRDHTGRVVSWFGTNTDVTAQREAEDALREADRRKDEFIAILAHELRNPLAPVRNAVEVLRLVGPAEPRVIRARDVIDRQVSHMARLIDDLLDVSRIARGKLSLQREVCDLTAIARQTTEDYRATLERAGLHVSAPPADALQLLVDGDPVRLAQMIGNLLHNAGRFTERGGHVSVRTGVVDGAAASGGEQFATIEVVDDGVGIEHGLLSRLFDPFSQADQDLARSKGGLGLGLALTKGLAELHGGSVRVHSEGKGRGSTFTLCIPLRRPPEDGHTAGQRNVTSARPEKLRVLVVEDNVDAAETMGELLELRGNDVKLAFDGASAVRIAKEFRPGVVISDIGLPGELDGYGVARALRAMPELSGTYLIALSGYTNDEARRLSREAGFHLHLGKPPDIAKLVRALNDATVR